MSNKYIIEIKTKSRVYYIYHKYPESYKLDKNNFWRSDSYSINGFEDRLWAILPNSVITSKTEVEQIINDLSFIKQYTDFDILTIDDVAPIRSVTRIVGGRPVIYKERDLHGFDNEDEYLEYAQIEHNAKYLKEKYPNLLVDTYDALRLDNKYTITTYSYSEIKEE